jgi:hypothetical protein
MQGNRHDIKSEVMRLLIGRLEVWHLANPRNTSCGPKVHRYEFAPEFGQIDLTPWQTRF